MISEKEIREKIAQLTSLRKMIWDKDDLFSQMTFGMSRLEMYAMLTGMINSLQYVLGELDGTL